MLSLHGKQQDDNGYVCLCFWVEGSVLRK